MSAAGGVLGSLMSRSWRSGGPHDDGRKELPRTNVPNQEWPVLPPADGEGEDLVSSQLLKLSSLTITSFIYLLFAKLFTFFKRPR